jgi:hypothetical protein
MVTQEIHATGRMGGSHSAVECRVHERHPCDLSASCQPASAWARKESRWAAVISDISLRGIRLILRRRFEPGAGLGIELPGHDGAEPCMVLARVVHVRQLPGGSWALGCKFMSELGEDELQRLLPPRQIVPSPSPQAAGPSEVPQPQAPAVGPSAKAVSEVQLEIQLFAGRVINLRIRRLAIPGSWPLPAGATLAIRGGTRQRRLPLLRLQVIQSSLRGERWTIRCSLLNPLTLELLRALGKRVKGASQRLLAMQKRPPAAGG